MPKRLRIISMAVIVATAVFAAAVRYELHVRAAAEALPVLLDLAPADSTFIAYADVAALRQASLIQVATALAQPPKTDKDYQEFVRGTGFDYEKDLDRVLVASKGNADPTAFVAVAEGRFDQQKIAAYAQREGKVENENGRTVYVMPSTSPGKMFSFAFLSAGRVAFSVGTDSFAQQGMFSSSPLDSAMRERLSRVAGAPFFLAAKTPPRSATPPGNAPAAFAASLFQSVTWVDFAAQPDGDNVVLSAEAECGTPEDAQKVATAIDLVRTMIQGAIAGSKGNTQMSPENVAAAERAMKMASVTPVADRVRLLVTVTPDMIKSLSAASQPPPAAH
jgi:hypothetical protein